VAALCAEEGRRKLVQRRIEAAIGLERYVMGGVARVRSGDEPPRELVAEAEAHLRALLRDVLCGYLDADLKGVADDILLEATSEPFMEIRARDLRARPAPRREEAAPEEPASAPEPDQDTSELPAVEVGPASEPAPAPVRQPTLEGVTASADWAWDDPEDYSAPV
jgi:hypothetical protein